jgi:hypothetical protein
VLTKYSNISTDFTTNIINNFDKYGINDSKVACSICAIQQTFSGGFLSTVELATFTLNKLF